MNNLHAELIISSRLHTSRDIRIRSRSRFHIANRGLDKADENMRITSPGRLRPCQQIARAEELRNLMCIVKIGVNIAGYEWLAVSPSRGQLSFSAFESTHVHDRVTRLYSDADPCTCTLSFIMEGT